MWMGIHQMLEGIQFMLDLHELPTIKIRYYPDPICGEVDCSI